MRMLIAAVGAAGTGVALLLVTRLAMMVVRVNGASMVPLLRPGDRVLAVRTWSARRIRRGDVVVCKPPNDRWAVLHGADSYLVKRVVGLPGDPLGIVGRSGVVPRGQVIIKGENDESYDSRQFGPVPRELIVSRVLLSRALVSRWRDSGPPGGTSRRPAGPQCPADRSL